MFHWKWKYGRYHWACRDIDEVIGFKNVFGRLWKRVAPPPVLTPREPSMLELHRRRQTEALSAQAELIGEADWWEVRIQECLAESRAIEAELSIHDTATEVVAPMVVPAYIATEVIRPRSLTESPRV